VTASPLPVGLAALHRAFAAVVTAALLGLVTGCAQDMDGTGPASAAAAGDEGPHGGRLLVTDGFGVEVRIVDTEAGATFELFPTLDGKNVAPAEVAASISVQRLTGRSGGRRDTFAFAPAADSLSSTTKVGEPHSFEVSVAARFRNRDYRWQYSSTEGLVTLPGDLAAAQGLATGTVATGRLRETIDVYGTIEAVPDRVRDVRARFPGIVRSVAAELGEKVSRGQLLATIESNESLQTYAVTAPVSGTVTARRTNPGEVSTDSLFTITDLTRVHADLTVFPRDRRRLTPGQRIEIRAADGDASGSAALEYLIPTQAGRQALLAHVELDNTRNDWTPGQFVTARIVVSETEVPVAVPLAAIQTWRDWESVFVVDGDRYQVQPVRLGRRDDRMVEVLDGLEPGARIVVANSYLVKADIEKSGATHDH
jgi:membrane fusion protein, heavy metal efflux system